MKKKRLFNHYFLYVLLSGWLLSGAAIRANAQERLENPTERRILTESSMDPLLLNNLERQGKLHYGANFHADATNTQNTTSNIQPKSLEGQKSGNTFVVTNTNDSGEGSLRWAIQQANATPELDVIEFNIPEAGPHYIRPTDRLGYIYNPIIIDGTSQPGWAPGAPVIVLDGSLTPDGQEGFRLFENAHGSEIRGLVIGGFDRPIPQGQFQAGYNGFAIVIEVNNTKIQGNFLGVAPDGVTPFPNMRGVQIMNSSNNLVGGATPEERNIISGNLAIGATVFGNEVRTGPNSFDNIIIGNYFGTDVTGLIRVANNNNIQMAEGPQNTIIGGNIEAHRNIISGANNAGVLIASATTQNTLIKGNFIGTNVEGTDPIGNRNGIFIVDGPVNTIIGGEGSGEGNVISGSADAGIMLSRTTPVFPVTGTIIKGNHIGLDQSGQIAIPNYWGIYAFTQTENSLIGGTNSAARNFISGNTIGITLTGVSNQANIIRGNYFGTNPSGTGSIANVIGISISGGANNNVVGGLNPGESNLISGNSQHGVSITGATTTGNQILGNTIGLNVSATNKLGNGTAGINLTGNNNLIKGNIISGNNFYGVQISVTSATLGNQNQIIGNLIGTTKEGQNLGNGSIGIYIVGGSNNKIGGTLPDEENVIAFTTGSGVHLASYPFTDPPLDPVGNAILKNSIYSNSQLGIRLAGLTIPANDADDADTGPNKLQNFPEISLASYGGGQMEVTYFVPSAPANSAYPIRVEFFRTNTNERQGKTFLGFDEFSVADHTAGTKTASFSVAPELSFEVGQQITATATDADGNTSHFGALVTSQPGQIFYAISSSAGPGGTIEPLGETEVAEGGSQLYVISPDTGFEIADVLVDGSSVGAAPSYLFEGVISNRTIHATFQKQTFTILASAGAGGSIDPVGSLVVEYGESQLFTITADSGYEIADVLVDGASVGDVNSYLFENVTSNRSIHATFEMLPPDIYTLALQVNPMGAGTVSGGGSYEAGQSAAVSATANAGFDFVNWTRGDVQVSAVADFSYEMPAENVTLVANFEKQTFTILASAGAGGSIDPVGSVVVEYGESQLFTITADSGYEIVDVLVDGVSLGAEASYTFENVIADHTIEAQFDMLPVETFTLTLQVNPMGAGTVSGGGSYEAGQSAAVSATANAGYDFVNWTRGGLEVSAVAEFSYEMPAENVTLVANFEKQTFTIAASAGTGGSIDPVGNVVVEYGENQLFAITADSGYEIVDVLVDGASVGAVPSYTFNNVMANHTIEAQFELLPPDIYTLTLQVNPMGAGTVSGGGSYEAGQMVAVSATANAGYDFVNWTRGGAEVSAVADFSYEMPAENVTLVANFIKQTFTILASAGTGGSIDPVGNVVVEYGENQLFAITADSGYEIVDVLVDGVSVGAVTYHTFTNVMADYTIEAQFEMLPLETFTLTLLAYPEDGGMVYGAGEYEAGAMINVSALANAGYRFLDWSRDEQFVSGMSAFVFIMPAMDVTLVASFEEAMGVYCTYSQGYWFAKPDLVWPYDVVVGGHTFTQAQGQQFWPSNTPTQRAFTQYATIYLSGVTLSEFPELAAPMQVIDHYFATAYPAPAGRDVNRAAGYIGKWIDENHCVVTLQGIAEFDMTGHAAQEVSRTGDIDARAYPNPFRRETTIEFMVQDNVYVTIEVFNMVGERISLLFEGNVAAFEQNMVTFKGNDLPNGFYFYRMTAGRNIHTGRLILAR